MQPTNVFKIVEKFIDAKPGFVNEKTSHVTGIVTEIKSTRNSNPIFFRIQDYPGFSTLLIRYIFDSNETPQSCPTSLFKTIKVGDCVDLWGFVRKTRNNKVMLDAMGIQNKSLLFALKDESDEEYHEETDYETDDEDEDYVPDSDEEYHEETDVEESEDESDEEVLESRLVITHEIAIDNDNVFFHGDRHQITSVNASPGHLDLVTDIGTFTFDDMRKGYLNISVDATRYEPEFERGYIILMKFKFHKILDVLI